MNSKTALCRCLLNGETINVRNIHAKTGYTNASREIIRQVESSKHFGFGVATKRDNKSGRNRYGVACRWIDYTLPKNKINAEGIKKMRQYIREQSKN
jgi:hypothetical protein